MNQTAPQQQQYSRANYNLNDFKNLSKIAVFLGVSEIDMAYLPTARLAVMCGTATRMMGVLK
jgi:hypothetical protein